MKKGRKLAGQIAVLCAAALIFVGFNAAIYVLLTRRLDNNFSDTTQAKMVDVARYLPFEESDGISHINSSFSLSGELPVLDGAAALLPVYASVIENVYPEGSVTYEGGKFSDDNFYGENFAPDSKMQYRNTVRGYTAVVDGDCDILFCAAPSAEQKSYADEKNVSLVCTPIGREAFVFFVNINNPVSGLTAGQIRGIYSGRYRRWSQVGGPERIINPVTRLEGSGSQSMMEAFMGDEPIGRKSLISAVGGSIGYSFRYYLEDMVGSDSVKTLAVNGVYPDLDNIRNGTYPLTAEFYAIYREDNPNPNIRLLIDWLLSDEGQELIEMCGYVRLP